MGNPPGFLDTIRWCPRCGRQKSPDGVGDLKKKLVAYSYQTTKGANSNSQSRNIPSNNHFDYFNCTFCVLGDLGIFSLLSNYQLCQFGPNNRACCFSFFHFIPDIIFLFYFPSSLFLFFVWLILVSFMFFFLHCFFVLSYHREEESQRTRKLFF